MKLVKAAEAPDHFHPEVGAGDEIEAHPEWDERTITALVAAGWVEAPKPAKKK